MRSEAGHSPGIVEWGEWTWFGFVSAFMPTDASIRIDKMPAYGSIVCDQCCLWIMTNYSSCDCINDTSVW